MIKLMDRYVLREMVVPFLIGQAAIVLLLTGSVLYNNADVLLVNQVPVPFVVRMVLYFIPFVVHMTMPVAMAVAASLAISRLSADREITVLRASGISLVRIFMPIFTLGLLLSFGDFFFGEYIVPASVDRFQAVLNEIPTHLPNLQPQSGQWITATDQSYAIFVRSMIPKHDYIEIHGIQIVASPTAAFNQEAEPIDIYAKDGKFANGVWTLTGYAAFKRSSKDEDWIKIAPTKTGVFTLTVSVDPQVFSRGFMLQLPMWKMAGSSTLTFAKLHERLQRNEQEGIHDIFMQLDYYFKLSIPFSCLAMALCCPPISLKFAKGGGFMGTLLSICLVFVYWNTMLLMRILGSPNAGSQHPFLPPIAAAWGQNILFVLMGLLVLRKSE